MGMILIINAKKRESGNENIEYGEEIVGDVFCMHLHDFDRGNKIKG